MLAVSEVNFHRGALGHSVSPDPDAENSDSVEYESDKGGDHN